MLDNPDIKIEQLQAERERCVVEIARIDRVLAAYKVLVDENILPPSNNLPRTMTQVGDSGQISQNGGRAAERDAGVEEVLKRIGQKSFTVSDIANTTGLDRRRVKRALDAKVQLHTIRLTRKGFRGRAARYRSVDTEGIPDEAEL